MTIRWSLVLPLTASLFTLNACGQVKEQLGLTRRTPDEFAVMARAPLEMPTSMTALPVPQPGAPRPQEVSPGQSAQNAVLGQSVSASLQESSAEASLLRQAGATNTDPNIRAVVNRESAEGAEDNRPVAKKLLGMVTKKDDEPATVVDAPGELKRLKENKQAGQPVTKGDTPTYDD